MMAFPTLDPVSTDDVRDLAAYLRKTADGIEKRYIETAERPRRAASELRSAAHSLLAMVGIDREGQ